MVNSIMRFSIRDVLWLTVVVGLAVGWWLDRKSTQRLLIEKSATVAQLSRELEERDFFLELTVTDWRNKFKDVMRPPSRAVPSPQSH